MLVHKRTMGILDYVWAGEYSRISASLSEPKKKYITISDVENPDEWWEIPNNSSLARTICRYYPWVIPKTDFDGNLIGVEIMKVRG